MSNNMNMQSLHWERLYSGCIDLTKDLDDIKNSNLLVKRQTIQIFKKAKDLNRHFTQR